MTADDGRFCMAPTGEVEIIAAQAAQTETPTPTQADSVSSSITAVSECHAHGSALYVLLNLLDVNAKC